MVWGVGMSMRDAGPRWVARRRAAARGDGWPRWNGRPAAWAGALGGGQTVRKPRSAPEASTARPRRPAWSATNSLAAAAAQRSIRAHGRRQADAAPSQMMEPDRAERDDESPLEDIEIDDDARPEILEYAREHGYRPADPRGCRQSGSATYKPRQSSAEWSAQRRARTTPARKARPSGCGWPATAPAGSPAATHTAEKARLATLIQEAPIPIISSPPERTWIWSDLQLADRSVLATRNRPFRNIERGWARNRFRPTTSGGDLRSSRASSGISMSTPRIGRVAPGICCGRGDRRRRCRWRIHARRQRVATRQRKNTDSKREQPPRRAVRGMHRQCPTGARATQDSIARRRRSRPPQGRSAPADPPRRPSRRRSPPPRRRAAARADTCRH